MYLGTPAGAWEIFCTYLEKQLCEKKCGYMHLSLVGRQAENLQRERQVLVYLA